jgi:hypothetical protein
MLDKTLEVWNIFESLLGVSPALMIPVFLIVSLISHGFKIRERFPRWSSFLLGVLCLVVGAAVGLLQEAEGIRAFIENGLILGSVSALAYQIIKGLLTGISEYIEKAWKKRMGTDISFSDDDHFI